MLLDIGADLAYRHGDISSALDGYRVALEFCQGLHG